MRAAHDLERLGWCRFAHDPTLAAWIKAVRPVAYHAAQDDQARKDWLRHGQTWFAGVNLLPNDPSGHVAGAGALRGNAVDFITEHFGAQSWDRAQISVIYPGYPKQDADESDAAHRFRRNRDAAHVDGLLPVGPMRRRHLHEPHGFVLGLPVNETSSGASPMIVWEGSHRIMREAFLATLKNVPPQNWSEIDLTDTYQAARRQCFEDCPRVAVHAQPGEAYLIDRLALHGVAPWADGATAPREGRVIAYFRPELADIAEWLG